MHIHQSDVIKLDTKNQQSIAYFDYLDNQQLGSLVIIIIITSYALK